MSMYLYDVITKETGDKRYLKLSDYVPYTLPIASESVLGGVKIGSGISITADGVISVNDGAWDSITGKPFSTLNESDFTVANAVLSINSTNWVKKTELQTYYTKDEINTLIANLKKATITIVEILPSTGEEGIIYFVGTKAPYEQYVWESGIGFIDIGSTEIDLSTYVTGSNLTADTIITGNGSKAVKSSGKKITTTLGTDDSTVPTSKAVKAVTDALESKVSMQGTTIGELYNNVNGNTIDIENLKIHVKTNASNIVINKENIATNASDIATNKSDIETLKDTKQDKLTAKVPLVLSDDTLNLNLQDNKLGLSVINNQLTNVLICDYDSVTTAEYLVIQLDDISSSTSDGFIKNFVKNCYDYFIENTHSPQFVVSCRILLSDSVSGDVDLPPSVWRASRLDIYKEIINYTTSIYLVNDGQAYSQSYADGATIDIALNLEFKYTTDKIADAVLNISVKVYE